MKLHPFLLKKIPSAAYIAAVLVSLCLGVACFYYASEHQRNMFFVGIISAMTYSSLRSLDEANDEADEDDGDEEIFGDDDDEPKND